MVNCISFKIYIRINKVEILLLVFVYEKICLEVKIFWINVRNWEKFFGNKNDEEVLWNIFGD